MKKRSLLILTSTITVCIAGIIVYCLSFRTNNSLRKEIIKMQGKFVSLSFESAEVFLNGLDTVYSTDENKKLIIFVDSLSCTHCFLNHMIVYYDINDSLMNRHGSLVIVLQPQYGMTDEIRKRIKMNKYPFWCIIDKNREFTHKNPNIPDNHLLHSFMLDKDDHIILVGDPSVNPKIKELLIKELAI